MFKFLNKKLHPSQYFLISAASFVAGIALASWRELDWRYWELQLLAMALSFLLALIFWRRFPFVFVSGLIGLFLFLGLWRYSLGGPSLDPGAIDAYQGLEIDVIGVISREPDRRSDKQLLAVAVERALYRTDNFGRRPDRTDARAGGLLLVYAWPFPELKYGDRIRFTGRIEAAEAIEDFRYDRWLAKSGFYSLCYYPDVFVIEPDQGSVWLARIYDFKQIVGRELDRHLGADQAALARAMILGDKGNLSEAQTLAFSQSGLAHLMAISGLHISLMAVMLLYGLVFIGLWRRQAFYGITILLFLYLLVIGFPPSALRAGFLAWLMLWAYHTCRLAESGPMLLGTAAATLFINPRLLRDDVGWQLSFLAILGIIYLFPWLEAAARHWQIPEKWNMRSIILMTLAVQLTTWPVVAGSFALFSLYAPLSNLLALPTMPLVIPSLLAGIALSWLPGQLPLIAFLPARLSLWYLDLAADRLANLPLAGLAMPAWPVWAYLAYYLFLGIAYFSLYRFRPNWLRH